ncbi:hypothetical protein B0H63DRAFT_484416 [Podospora didyma]|uniref:Uncharacterized protein n=1 Tax=Podospora didyma TaxID=330526 RepID=A0AAE0K946_9PEZI|nr:hypothetical protein B0H63DRAFT_484416 [Podospora didyma]
MTELQSYHLQRNRQPANMSSPSSPPPPQMSERPGRPVPSFMPSQSGSHQGSPDKQFKAYGQDYQYAETWANPLPELIVDAANHQTLPAGSAGTAGRAVAPVQNDGAQSETDDDGPRMNEAAVLPRRLTPTGDSIKGPVIPETIWLDPDEEPWYRRIQRRWVIYGTVIAVGIIAVLLAILGAMGVLSHKSSADETTATTNSTTSGPTSTSSAVLWTSTRPVPTSGATHIDCSDQSTFFKDMGFVTGVGPDGSFNAGFGAGASSAEDCCKNCLDDGEGCIGWLFDKGNRFTPCTKVVIVKTLSNNDTQCPNGYADSTSFSKGSVIGVVGMGPCSHGSNIV